MAKWVLDTETKGTGANVVPLEKVLRRPDPDAKREPVFVPPKPRRREPPPPPPKQPPRFRVVDVITGQTLADHASGRETVDVLKDVRSVIDVRLWRWEHEAERWHPLTLSEQRAIWELRDR
jgi:hypothetical protein